MHRLPNIRSLVGVGGRGVRESVCQSGSGHLTGRTDGRTGGRGKSPRGQLTKQGESSVQHAYTVCSRRIEVRILCNMRI